MYQSKVSVTSVCTSQEVGGTLIGEDGLVAITGAESGEWYQIQETHGFHGFQVFDAIPFAPFPAIVMSRPPISSLLWCVYVFLVTSRVYTAH